jgi:hypothetical protein
MKSKEADQENAAGDKDRAILDRNFSYEEEVV